MAGGFGGADALWWWGWLVPDWRDGGVRTPTVVFTAEREGGLVLSRFHALRENACVRAPARASVVNYELEIMNYEKGLIEVVLPLEFLLLAVFPLKKGIQWVCAGRRTASAGKAVV